MNKGGFRKRATLSYGIRGIALAAVLLTGAVVVRADEIRVVDARGLVRAVKVSRGAVRMVVSLEIGGGASPRGECVATNVDGLAAEKRVQVSTKSECIFNEITGGSWQITVPAGFSWRVQLYE